MNRDTQRWAGKTGQRFLFGLLPPSDYWQEQIVGVLIDRLYPHTQIHLSQDSLKSTGGGISLLYTVARM